MTDTGYLPIDSITVLERIRTEPRRNWNDFFESFPVVGQLQPIAVFTDTQNPGKYILDIGEGRLDALKKHHANNTPIPNVPPGMIRAEVIGEPPRHIKMLREFIENEGRDGFGAMDRARFVRQFHDTMREEYPDWTQDLTARTLHINPATISHLLRIEEAAKADPTIAKSVTLVGAVNKMKAKEALDKRKEDAKSDDSVTKRAEAILHRGDAREWIKTIPDQSVDLVNFDPPWGGDTATQRVFEAHEEGFEEDPDVCWSLMCHLIPELYRVLKEDRFMIVWHNDQFADKLLDKLLINGFNIKHYPSAAIWYKPDKVVDHKGSDGNKRLVPAYEKFYIVRKGEPLLHHPNTEVRNNVFVYNRVPLAQIIHPTEKPLALNTDLIKLFTVPGETVLDPTSGSSSFPDAGIRCGRKALACELAQGNWEKGIMRMSEYLKTFTEAT
jgi:site-specific DNA-methyltransferase (adenine-specific)